MSRSLLRVKSALLKHGIRSEVREVPDGTRTAAEAANAAVCELDQIVKSIIFKGTETGGVQLFLTAGGNRVDAVKASALAGEALGRADADSVRAATGFAIGGVAPVAHLIPIPTWWDPRLSDFPVIWAAAGTPHHVFPVAPAALAAALGAPVADFTA
jgi:prolyl-tRNA editing enzyme YbaK/EbsC (Cys-tRNA(Pro) deacylase)